jgi:hypothetical protein
MKRSKVRPGVSPWVQVDVELKGDGELSICGSVGSVPGQGGEGMRCEDGVFRRMGGCGQVVGDIERAFPEIAHWLPYHLNHMRAECEHQRALGWPEKARVKATRFLWNLTDRVLSAQNELKRKIEADLRRDGRVELSPTDLRLYRLEWERYTWTPVSPGPDYKERSESLGSRAKVETLGWLRPAEHPEGLLTRACPTCGYKYGNAWQKQEIPAEILTEIEVFLATGELPQRQVPAGEAFR